MVFTNSSEEYLWKQLLYKLGKQYINEVDIIQNGTEVETLVVKTYDLDPESFPPKIIISAFLLKFYRWEFGDNDRRCVAYACKVDDVFYRVSITIPIFRKEKPYRTELLSLAGCSGFSCFGIAGIKSSDGNIIKFFPEDILVKAPLKGLGLTTYIYTKLINLLKKEINEGEVVPLKLSAIDAVYSPDKDNWIRRDTFYINLGFKIKENEKGEGWAYIEDFKLLRPRYNKKKIKETVFKDLKEFEERWLKEIESRAEEHWKYCEEQIKIMEHIIREHTFWGKILQTQKHSMFHDLFWALLMVGIDMVNIIIIIFKILLTPLKVLKRSLK